MKRVNVVVAATSPVVLRGFSSFLERHPRIGIVGTALTLKDLVQVVAMHTQAVVIMDWEFVAGHTGTSAEQVRALTARAKIIFSSIPEALGDRRFALHLGARGFIGRQQSAQGIARIVLRVASGRFHVGAESAEALLELEFSQRDEAGRERRARTRVTARERELIYAVCRGLTNKAIAEDLRIAEATVCHHLTSVYAKLAVHNRAALIVYAFKHGLNAPEGEPGSNVAMLLPRHGKSAATSSRRNPASEAAGQNTSVPRQAQKQHAPSLVLTRVL